MPASSRASAEIPRFCTAAGTAESLSLGPGVALYRRNRGHSKKK